MNAANPEMTLNEQAEQPADPLRKPLGAAENEPYAETETEQRHKTNSFIGIIRRASVNSLIEPIPTDMANSTDENEIPLKSPTDLKDEKKKAFLSSHVLLQYCTLFTLCFNLIISVGTCYSLGVLYVPIRNDFNASKTLTSLIVSVCIGVLEFGGVFSGMLVHRLQVRRSVILSSFICFLGLFLSAFVTNIWYFIVLLGFLLGAGASIMNVAKMVSVSRIFNKKKNLMIMVATTSIPIGTLCIPQLMRFLLDFYGWRGMLIILSGLELNMCFAGFLSSYLEKPTVEIQEKPKHFDATILHKKTFLIFLVVSSVSLSCWTVPSILVVDFWNEKSKSMLQSVSILTFSSTAAISSRFFLGACNTLHDMSKFYLAIFYSSAILGGLTIVFIPQCVSFIQIDVVIIMFGFFHGILGTLRPVIFLEIVGLSSYSVAYGLSNTCRGLGSTIATIVAGKIGDLTHSYDVSFYSAGITESALGLILCVLHFWFRRKSRNKTPDTRC